MNKDLVQAKDLIVELKEGTRDLSVDVEVLVAPPFPYLSWAVDKLRNANIKVAAQNCHQAAEGAYTGEVSVGMLGSIGVGSCIVGHSERRQYFGETDALIAQKITALLAAGLRPIYCCGESKAEREAGAHFKVVGQQLEDALGGLSEGDLGRIVIAYEPVWAIGTGLTATPEQAQEMHAFIREELRKKVSGTAEVIPILYGGSCKPDNAEGLFSLPDINGGLIGGASLDASQFLELVSVAARTKKG